jgi:alkylation response protein AidB-like acyl-CoA dehydrogenase
VFFLDVFIRTEKQRQWLEKLSTVEEKIKQSAQQIDESNEFCGENIQTLRNLGYSKLTLPKEYGGEGFNVYDALLVHEKLSSLDGSTALTICWTVLCVGDIYQSQYWDKEKLEFFANEVLNGAITNRIASEAATGSPIRGGKPQTTAVKQGNQWVINGRKSFVTGSYELDYFIVTAWIEEKNTVGNFLISKNREGLTIEETWDVVSMRGTGSHDLIINNVLVDESNLVEIPSELPPIKGNGWGLLIPATYLGIANAARDYALEFANTHSPNSITGTIATLPNVQKLLGEIDLELTKSRLVLYGVAEAVIDPERAKNLTNEMNVAKHIVVNSAITIVDKAMRLVGAKSLQRSNPLQRYYRDVRAGLHNPPMDDLTISKLAHTAIQQYQDAKVKENEVQKV